MSVVEFKLHKPDEKVIQACEKLLELAKSGQMQCLLAVGLNGNGLAFRLQTQIMMEDSAEMVYELEAAKQQIVFATEEARGYEDD